jgi:hypothetical protein
MILVCYEMQRIFILYNMINLLVFSERICSHILLQFVVQILFLLANEVNLLQ